MNPREFLIRTILFFSNLKQYLYQKSSLCFFGFDVQTNTAIACKEPEDDIHILTSQSKDLLPETFKHNPVWNVRMQRGDFLCAILKSNEIVSYGWVARQETFIREVGCNITPDPDQVYIYDCFTSPQHRQKGFYSRVLNKIIEWSHSENIKHLVIFSEASNVASKKGIESAGFQFLFPLDYSIFLGRFSLDSFEKAKNSSVFLKKASAVQIFKNLAMGN